MLTNRDIRVSTSGFSADPQKYNLNSSMDGNVKTQIFYNKQKEYLLMAKSTSGAPNNATEVYRQSILPESGYYIRKISYNSPARAENANLSLSLCEAEKGKILNNISCTSVNGAFCEKLKKIDTKRAELNKCGDIMRDLFDIYDDYLKSEDYKNQFSNDKNDIKSTYAKMGNIMNVTNVISEKNSFLETKKNISKFNDLNSLCRDLDLAVNGYTDYYFDSNATTKPKYDKNNKGVK